MYHAFNLFQKIVNFTRRKECFCYTCFWSFLGLFMENHAYKNGIIYRKNVNYQNILPEHADVNLIGISGVSLAECSLKCFMRRVQFFAAWNSYSCWIIFVYFSLPICNSLTFFTQNFSVHERCYLSCNKTSLPLVEDRSVQNLQLVGENWPNLVNKCIYIVMTVDLQIFSEGNYQATVWGYRF